MNELRALPELGIGVMYWPRFEDLLDLDDLPIDVIEIEPQAYWFSDRSDPPSYKLDARAFHHIHQLRKAKLIHGVGFPIGGTISPQLIEMLPFRESIEVLQAPWASEHLSFNRIRGQTGLTDLGFLLPPVQSKSSVETCVANIVRLKQHIPVPFAFETGVNYLKRSPLEMTDGAFSAAVAIHANCGILLDIHNLWTNERNGRQAVMDVVSELPLERVIEIHLAGGEEFSGYWVDAHSGLVPLEVMDLARSIIPMLPNLKAIIYEVMPEHLTDRGDISADSLAQQINELRELWLLRCIPSTVHVTQPVRLTDDSLLPSPQSWEEGLGQALLRHELPQSDSALNSDPGLGVLRKLIAAARAGKIAASMTLTARMLLLCLGEQGAERLFEDFWAAVPTRKMTSEEAIDFAEFLRKDPRTAEIEGLREIVDFELAAHRAVMTGRPQRVSFSCDPEMLMSALREGRSPRILTRREYDVTVAPP